jgi:hypothetical protein
VLAGWPNGRVTVYPPTPQVIFESLNSDKEKNFFASFRNDLFWKVNNKYGLDSEVIDILFATLLKNYRECVLKYPHHIVYTRVIETGIKYGFTATTLMTWSQIIEQDFLSKNSCASNVTPTIDNATLNYLISLNKEVQKVRDENKEIKSILLTIAANFAQGEIINRQNYKACLTRTASELENTSPEKRRREASNDTTIPIENIVTRDHNQLVSSSNNAHLLKFTEGTCYLDEFWVKFHIHLCHKYPRNVIYNDDRMARRFNLCLKLMTESMTIEEKQWLEKFKGEYKVFIEGEKYKQKLGEIGKSIQQKVMDQLESLDIENIGNDKQKLENYKNQKNKRKPTITAVSDRYTNAMKLKEISEKAKSSHLKNNSYFNFFKI